MACGHCGSPLSEGSRFCSTCGTPVPGTLTEERKVVTVVFADVVGYTVLSEGRDPEHVARLIDGCLARLVADATSFGGTVDKLLGDGMLALFGAPTAHEDDAERAVRAALRMIESVREYASEHGSSLQLRVGVNTGEVLVGALRAGGDYTAMGDVVNIAQRLQAAAPVDRVLVGERTKELAESGIAFEAFGDVVLRGREHNVAGWLAVETTALPGARRRREDSQFVGRDAELALLSSGVEFSLTRRRALLIAIEGEGGVGKSRLVEELLSPLRNIEQRFVLEGQCVPYGESNVWWPLASGLQRAFGADEGADPDGVRRRIVRQISLLLQQPEDAAEVVRVADAFTHLLGRPSPLDELEPTSVRAEIGRSVVRGLRASVQVKPIIASITDLHWADPAVLDLFEQILVNLADTPLVLITTSRPDGGEVAWPPPGGSYGVLRLRLDPLDAEAAAVLASNILGEVASADTLTRLFERSGGNPLFLEELATLTAERGSATALPDSLRGIIAARLDQLPSDQRSILDNAAVLGTSGPWSALKRFGDETSQPATESTLTALVEAGLLAIDGQRWSFRSESVRDVAYQTLTKGARAQRHVGVARAMAESSKRSIEDVAHHWAAAAELAKELGRVAGVPPDVRERAIQWLGDAAEHAVEQMYSRTCIRLSSRGLDLLAGDSDALAADHRRRLRIARADGLLNMRKFDQARADLDLVITRANEDGDHHDLARAHRLLGELHRLDGDVQAARSAFDKSITLWRSLDHERGLARALRGRGFLEVFSGTAAFAEPYFEEADALYTSIGDKRGRAWLQQHRAWGAFSEGDLEAADTLLHQAAETMQELGDRAGLGWVFGLLAYVRFNQGNRAEAETIAAMVTSEAAERGDDWAPGMMNVLRANLALWEGRTDDAVALADRSRLQMRRIGDAYGQVMAYAPLARGYAALGQAANAQRAIEEMRVAAEGSSQAGFPMAVDAEVALHLGEPSRALRSAEECMAGVRVNELGGYEVYVVRAMALLQLGRLDEALVDLAVADSVAPGLPFGSSVAAVAATLESRLDEAVTLAERVWAMPEATYLDRLYAAFGHAGALRRLADEDGVLRILDDAHATAGATGDVIAVKTVAVIREAFLPTPPPLDSTDPPDVSSPADMMPLAGWRALGEQLAAS